MSLNLIKTIADTAVQSGSSGSLTVSIPSNRQMLLVLAVATSNRTFGSVTSARLTTPSASDFLALTQEVSSIGTEIWYLNNPPYTPGITTQDIEIELSGSYTFAMSVYIFEVSASPPGASGLNAAGTGNPSVGTFTVDVGAYLIDAVAIESNTISADNDQVEVMNLVSGGNSYGSSYKICDSTSESMSWTRTGTPVNDSWAICAAEIEQNATAQRNIITS